MTGRVNLVNSSEAEVGTESNPLVIKQPNSGGSLATSALQTAGNDVLIDIDTKLGGTLTVNVGLTDTQLRASPVAVSASSLPLPTNAATSALQTTGNNTLSAIDTKLGGTLSVNVGLTDAELRAAPVPVSGTVTANAGTGNFNTKPDGTLWTLTGTSANVNITNASVAVTKSGTWAIDNTAAAPANTTQYTATGSKALYANAESYALNCITGAIGAVAAGTTIFSMRNTGAKAVYISLITIESQFLGTAAATVSHFQLQRFSTATPTGGTALTVAKKVTANAATSVGDARFSATGLTTTGVVFSDVLMGHSQVSQLTAQSETILSKSDITAFGRIVLASGEGLCVRPAIATTIPSNNLNINIEWEEV